MPLACAGCVMDRFPCARKGKMVWRNCWIWWGYSMSSGFSVGGVMVWLGVFVGMVPGRSESCVKMCW